jgi:chemotaxis protein CheC
MPDDTPASPLSPLERDALQEVMNIGFGQAAADLSAVIHLYVTLTVPYIDVMHLNDVHQTILREVPDTNDMSMITQFFSGRFNGTAFLVFPHGEGKKLLRMFSEDMSEGLEELELDLLARDSLIEVSNIIIGACISKIAELLKDRVSYSPPRYYGEEQIETALKQAFGNAASFAIFFKTVFHFKDFDATGFLFLVSNDETLKFLRSAIDGYLAQYA